ncbi:hypothetical protein DV736_g4359, partial [Chaetothyriales sp. CBS 134916]
MKYAFVVAALASLAAAQTVTSEGAAAATTTTSAASSTTSSSCTAQDILDACIGTIQGQINSCATTDYSCLCTNYINLLVCYTNCPSDPGVGTVQQQREQNCNAASVYGSTTILKASTEGSSTATATTGEATTSDSSDTAVQTGFASGSGSATASSASATSSSKNGAATVEIAGGLLAVVAAGFGLLL